MVWSLARRLSRADTPPAVKRTLAQEFFDFLKTFGIIGLAIAFVIGQAASRLVTAFVNDIIDPIIGFFFQLEVLKPLVLKLLTWQVRLLSSGMEI